MQKIGVIPGALKMELVLIQLPLSEDLVLYANWKSSQINQEINGGCCPH